MVIYFNEVIISSGGIKGCALLGALTEFLKNYYLKKINYYTGCSAGSIICLLLNLDYTINEINEIMFKINFSIFQDLKVVNLIEKYGLDEGIKFTNFFRAIIINKNYNSNITFKELYNNTKKILTFSVTNITKGIPEYHNYITTPDLSILLSLRMSMNIPILFAPIFYNNNYYVDGALLDPFPYFYNKNTYKIGFWIFDKNELNFIKHRNGLFIKELSNSFTYIIELLKIIYINYMKKYYKKIPENVIYINFDLINEHFEKFDLKYEDKIKIFNIGKKKYKLFLKKKKKKILIKKYFNRWKKINL